MQIVNMFLVPMAAVAVHYRRKGSAPRLSVSTLVCYGVYTAVLSVVMRLVSRLLSMPVYAVEGFEGSVGYTLTALAAALLLPLLAEFISKYFGLKVTVEKNERS